MQKNAFNFSLLILTILLIFSLSYSPLSHAEQNITQPRHVLLLHSYHKGMTWADDITNSVTATLVKTDPDIEFHVEYMDTKRILGEEHLANLYTGYRFKFKHIKFDAVVIVDDGALRFALKHYDGLFPGTPVVFCGINNLEQGMLDNHPEFTGILEQLDIAETLRIALNLHPDARRVYIINDMSPSGKGLHKEIAKVIPAFAARAEFTFLEDYTSEELAAFITTIPSNSIILRSAFFLDKAGHALPNEKISYAAVGSSARVPVYSLWDFYIGHGVVGGKMVSGTGQGELAARLVTRIFRGEKPSSIPVVVKSPNRLMFDYQQMKRFGISRSSLPPGSTIFNEPLPFYAINKALTWTGLLFTLAMTIVTMLLVLSIKRRKRTEGALKESEERFRLLMENIPSVAVQGYALDGTVIFWNRASELLYGYSAKEALNANILDLIIPSEMRGTVRGAMRQMIETGVPVPAGELLLKRKDGSGVPVLSSHALVNPFGKQTELFCLDIDLTARKLSEEALLESEFRWKFAIEGSGDGVWDWNFRTDEVKYSKRWKEILGYAENDSVPSHHELLALVHTDDQSLVAEALQEYLEGKTAGYVVEYRLRCKDKSYKWILSRGMVVSRSEDGRPLRMIGTHTDISERKEYEKEQLKIEKLESLGVLAGGIAHDFNNILTGIIGNISFAQMFIDTTHKSFKPLAEAEKASVRAGELAHQLLTFARGGEPVKKVVSLQHLVNETVSLVLHGSNVKGKVDISASIHAIEADEGQMSQVFHNLIINASQAMPGGGTLTITAQNENIDDINTLSLPAGTYIRLTFVDQGCGISDDDLKRIFDPYFTTKLSGNGLGLASVHSIVSRHGGHIGAESAPGKGTTFTIYLPSISETYSKYQNDSASRNTGNHAGGSILVMDDEEIIRDMAAEMLVYLGYRVTTCENGSEAITKYKAAMESGSPFSAVIMDLTIPGGMGGKEAAEHVLALHPEACLIVSSGYSNDQIMSDYETYGFNSAMAKPYKIVELAQLLSSSLSKSSVHAPVKGGEAACVTTVC